MSSLANYSNSFLNSFGSHFYQTFEIRSTLFFVYPPNSTNVPLGRPEIVHTIIKHACIELLLSEQTLWIKHITLDAFIPGSCCSAGYFRLNSTEDLAVGEMGKVHVSIFTRQA